MTMNRRQLLAICAVTLASSSSALAVAPVTKGLMEQSLDQPCDLSHALAAVMNGSDPASFFDEAAKSCVEAEGIAKEHSNDKTPLERSVGLRSTLEQMGVIKQQDPLNTVGEVVKILAPIFSDNADLFSRLRDTPKEVSEKDYARLVMNLARLTIINSALLNFPVG
jgi:hypothetical protein